ncbi:MAG: hypothetical protein ACKO13_10110, partial [Cytophagales bacterium]
LLTLVAIQSCKDDPAPAPPTLTGPAAVASVQVGTKADVTFTFTAAAGYTSSAVTATGGNVAIKTDATAGSKEGSIVTEFTAGSTSGAGSVTLVLTDAKGKTATQTAVLNITISAPPSVTLSASTASVAAGSTVNVTVTITAANGAKNISYITTGGVTGSPASPIAISGNPTAATNQVVTLSVPATAAVGGTVTAVFTGSDNQNLNSSPVTFTITVSDVANVLTGTPTSDLTLTAGTPWTVKNQLIIGNGRTLTVNAGAIVKGDKATKGVIIIAPGGRLIANGTASNPIVFTSSQPVGERDRGDWGGIVWLGNAFVNQSSAPAVEGISPAITYGTASTSDANAGNNTENNGSLTYARIEYAGIELSPNNETNGLTMGGLGSGTTIDRVQVSYGGDDAFEWFGGTVNGTRLVSFATWDDDFDTDFGWRGRVQFGVAIRAPFIADQSGSTAFESDSSPNANPIGSICTDAAKTGCTQGVFSNMTVYGPREYSRGISGSYTRAIHIRRRTAVSIFNSVVTGFLEGVRIDDQGTSTNYPTTYDATAAASTSLGKLANNELYVSLLPNVPSDIGSNPNAVTSIGNATGNNMFSVGGGLTPSTFAQSAYRAAGAGNNDYAPVFVGQWLAGGAGQALRNNWQAASGSITETNNDPANKDVNTISFATGIGTNGGGIIVNGSTTGSAWSEGTAVPLVNPYVGSGLRTGPFYAANSSSSYPANPDFTLNTADATVAGKRLDKGATFTDARLTGAVGGFTFTTTTYRGAFDGTTDWTDGWTNFLPINAQY